MTAYEPQQGFLNGVRVLQLTDEKGDFAGKVLAGLGAEVIMVEPRGGSPSRRIGPFADDEPGPENSLFHWHYNVGKRSIALDLDDAADRETFRQLALRADVLLESMPPGYLDGLGLGYDNLKADAPGLIVASISPFGQTGPWRDRKAGDLVHLALGGEMNYTRYAPKLDGSYDTPPIAGQMWQSYHFTGDWTVHAILASLLWRMSSGKGQHIDAAIHQVMSVATEIDFPAWVYSKEAIRPQEQGQLRFTVTKDGRWVLSTPSTDGTFGVDFEANVRFLKDYDATVDLEEEKYRDKAFRAQPEVGRHAADLINRVTSAMPMEEAWHAGQKHGHLWAAIRKAEENLTDRHWASRATFGKVEHPERGASYTYPVSRWLTPDAPWQAGGRAPRIDEHGAQIRRELGAPAPEKASPVSVPATPKVRPLDRQAPLAGTRMLDLTQLLATAGGTRILSGFGVEAIRVEWKNRPDLRYFAQPPAPAGTPPHMNKGGYFNDINAGRLGVSLNMTTDKGKELFRRLLAMSDLVAEGYRPGAMEKFGLGYEAMKAIKSDIVYVQQSGFGKQGVYDGYGAVGPVANAISGITEMSGLPEPYPPRGWLYSFMDFGGAFNSAMAMLAGLYYRKMTGKGIYIDSSQIEPGIYFTGTAILDYQVNGRRYARSGNRSPNLAAAPHGAYPCNGPASPGAAGAERWIAISCFDEVQWQALAGVMGNPEWARAAEFSTLKARLRHQDALDAQLGAWTRGHDAFELMERLQAAGVPAGVVQTVQERIDRDPQLRHLGWTKDLPHSEMGTYPVKAFTVGLSATPGDPGGVTQRGAPCYGEDNDYVYGELLGLSTGDRQTLQAEGVI